MTCDWPQRAITSTQLIRVMTKTLSVCLAAGSGVACATDLAVELTCAGRSIIHSKLSSRSPLTAPTDRPQPTGKLMRSVRAAVQVEATGM